MSVLNIVSEYNLQFTAEQSIYDMVLPILIVYSYIILKIDLNAYTGHAFICN